MIRRALCLAAVLVAVLAGPPAGHSAGGRGPWQVVWTPAHCPRGALCKRWAVLEPNYGQALKLERTLERAGELVGYRVWLVQVSP